MEVSKWAPCRLPTTERCCQAGGTARRAHLGMKERRLRPPSRPSRHGLSKRNPRRRSIAAWAKYATALALAHAVMLKRCPYPALRHRTLPRSKGVAYLAHAVMSQVSETTCSEPQLARRAGVTVDASAFGPAERVKARARPTALQNLREHRHVKRGALPAT